SMSTLDGPLSTTRYFGILFGQHPDNMETQLIDFINTNAGSIPAASTNTASKAVLGRLFCCLNSATYLYSMYITSP
ncbi:MAG: hypothetical protein RPU52_06310, partial [Candidatus Sedimenticola sp. (ex Thyasira tokunagai)]